MQVNHSQPRQQLCQDSGEAKAQLHPLLHLLLLPRCSWARGTGQRCSETPAVLGLSWHQSGWFLERVAIQRVWVLKKTMMQEGVFVRGWVVQSAREYWGCR